MIRTAIVVGSTRPGRKSHEVAQWVHEHAADHAGVETEVVDLADFSLPHLDEPVPAARSTDYQQPHTREWSAAVGRFDAFIFVTPEYNHGIPSVLKTAIDFLFEEWHDKPAGFVSYGLNGGVRAVEQLRLVMAEIKIADIRSQVALSLFSDFEDMSELRPGPQHLQILNRMLDELALWGGALKQVRAGRVATV